MSMGRRWHRVRKRGRLAAVLLGLGLTGWAALGQAAALRHDGRIAFAWFADTRVAPQSCGDIFSIEPSGSGRQRLTPGCPWEYSAPEYSASGNRIVFVRSHEPFPRDRHGAGIYVMAADGSHLRRITSSGTDENPSLSPNGGWIVFDRYLKRSGRSQIFRASSGGGQVRQLTHGAGASQPSFSSDGRWIVFVGGRSSIYRMRSDGSHVRKIASAPGRLQGWYEHPQISPDGRHIVAICGFGDGFSPAEQLCIMRADGTSVRHLTPARSLTVIDAAFSPDGRRIAFLAWRGQSVFLFTISPGGSQPHQVYDLGTHEGGASLGVSWQPLP